MDSWARCEISKGKPKNCFNNRQLSCTSNNSWSIKSQIDFLTRLEQGQDLPKISILRALQLLVASWNDVTKTTIVNWFEKAKISAKDQVNAAEDSDGTFKELENDLTELRKIDPTLVLEF